MQNKLFSLAFTPKKLSVGIRYCAFNQSLYEWQRCEVLFLTKNDASILFIDIGSTVDVPITSIKLLQVFFKFKFIAKTYLILNLIQTGQIQVDKQFCHTLLSLQYQTSSFRRNKMVNTVNQRIHLLL